MEVHFKGDWLDEHGQKLYAFEAQVPGYEWSTLLFSLTSTGQATRESKEFVHADSETREEAIHMAREQLATM